MSLFDAPLPGWGFVDYGGGVRVAGFIEETEIGNATFVSVTPPGRSPLLINASHVVTIHPSSEEIARAAADRQWRAQENTAHGAPRPEETGS